MDLGLGHLTELKTHLLAAALRSSTDYDAAIAALGKGVAARFEQHCDRKFGRVVGDTHECGADREHVSLPRYPLEAVTAVALRENLADGFVDQGDVDDIVENIMEASGLVMFGVALGGWKDRLRLTYTGGYWYPTAPAVVIQRATVAVAADAASVAVVFPTAFSAAPAVQVSVVGPDGGTIVTATAYEITAAGFTARFSAAVPASGYSISYIAVESPNDEADATILQQGSAALTLAAESKAVVFGTAFDAAPVVVCNVVAPDGGLIITAVPTLVTASGFTALLGYPIPATGYTLDWVAVSTTAAAAAQSLPTGATQLPADLKLAWLLQCEFLWKIRDKLGLEIAGGAGNAAQAVPLTLAGAKLIPDVEETLARYKRLSL